MTTTVRAADLPEDLSEIRRLFREYADGLEVDLSFQGFEEEISGLPGKYAPPEGRLLLACKENRSVGCVALRRIDASTAEMKRLYVRPEFRGKGLGRKLTESIIEASSEIDYQRLRLDTLPGKMDRAIAMYRSLGFKSIERYYNNPYDEAAYMELFL